MDFRSNLQNLVAILNFSLWKLEIIAYESTSHSTHSVVPVKLMIFLSILSPILRKIIFMEHFRLEKKAVSRINKSLNFYQKFRDSLRLYLFPKISPGILNFVQFTPMDFWKNLIDTPGNFLIFGGYSSIRSNFKNRGLQTPYSPIAKSLSRINGFLYST